MSKQYRLYLHPNGYFYHRVKVPVALRALYCKSIEQNSLRTRDYRDALRRLPAVIVAVDQAFNQIIVENHAAFCGDFHGRSAVVFRGELKLNHRCGSIRCDDTPDDGSTSLKQGGVREGDLLAQAVASASPLEALTTIPVRADLPRMSVISHECFAAIEKEKNWSAKTVNARRTQIRQFIDVCGDRALNRYNQDDIRLFKRVLLSLPPQAHSNKEFRQLSKMAVAEIATERGMTGLSVESVRQIMTAVNIVFGWARAQYDISLKNIVQPMIPLPSSGLSKRDKREAFSSAELQMLFGTPVFIGCESEDAWLKSGSFRMQRNGRFWVPLLCLYTGARLMEAVQLLQSDVRFESGVWFIRIDRSGGDNSGKSVKNEYSIRSIPLHPELLRLGFPEFVKSVRNSSRLFPDIPLGPDFQRHRHASKMFSKLLSVAGIKSPKKVWHSLRHSFEQACRDSRVDSAIMDQLQGHASKTSMRDVCGKGYNLIALNDGICSITYDGLDLCHIEGFSS